MSDTIVNTEALAAAGAAVSRSGRELQTVTQRSSHSVGRLAEALSGSQTSPQLSAVRQMMDAVLPQLGQVLSTLGQLLAAAAVEYRRAEGSATSVMTPVTNRGAG